MRIGRIDKSPNLPPPGSRPWQAGWIEQLAIQPQIQPQDEETILAEYRIDDLARQTGTTVRSLRVLHDKSLLQPPALRGRTGWYDDAHLARVRLVLRLQERGFTLSAIGELIRAWENGLTLADVLGVPS
jgi:MerR HTH family regulatory protein